jgi:hypothetical protein
MMDGDRDMLIDKASQIDPVAGGQIRGAVDSILVRWESEG